MNLVIMKRIKSVIMLSSTNLMRMTEGGLKSRCSAMSDRIGF